MIKGDFTMIGLDNGVSGSIGIITDTNMVYYIHTPVFEQLNYTKKKQFLNRVDVNQLEAIFDLDTSPNRFAVIERPMINPQRWKASMSAIRCLEATLCVLEHMKIGYRYLDSKEWQRVILPKGLQKEELKKASLDIGKRTFPQIDFSTFDDADGLLIAEYSTKLKSIPKQNTSVQEVIPSQP